MGYSRGMLRAVLLVVVLLVGAIAAAVETLTFEHRPYADADPRTLSVAGRTLKEDSVGNRYFETVDGARYLVGSASIESRASDTTPFAPASHEAMGERLLAELPDGFRVHTTEHYVVAYDTSREFAEWASSLFEGLHRALVRYWGKQGLELTEPEFPLPIVIHRDRAAYDAAARAEGVGLGAIGYYHLTTNRVRMYDLTGAQELRATGYRMRRGSRSEISRMLSLPAAQPLVATLVHEATHQVCFNAGVMQRLADLPLWLVEGMATYFEAPNAGSLRGWRGIGKVNQLRLRDFRRNLPQWNQTTVLNLVASDKRLRDPRTGGRAYADAWAMNYYLIKRRGDDYVAYVKAMAERKPFAAPPADESEEATARRRVATFEKHFGDIRQLQADLLKAMTRL